MFPHHLPLITIGDGVSVSVIVVLSCPLRCHSGRVGHIEGTLPGRGLVQRLSVPLRSTGMNNVAVIARSSSHHQIYLEKR